MSAELLRRAAKQMRERASGTTPSPWYCSDKGTSVYTEERSRLVAITGIETLPVDAANGEHIASWHPAVALAVADILDFEAALAEGQHASVDRIFGEDARDFYREPRPRFVTLARAYLGGAS